MADNKLSTFEVLQKLDVSEFVKKKGEFSYLSWAHAWQLLKSKFPDASYRIYENENGWNYFTDGATAWVKVGVTVSGVELIEYYPVTDYRNNSFPLDKVTSRIINDSIQRALVKCMARHGLGLYIYAGEDIPMSDPEEKAKEEAEARAKLEGDIASLKGLLSDCDLKKVAKLYKKNSLDEFNAKEVSNALSHISEIKERCGVEDAFVPEVAEEDKVMPKPEAKTEPEAKVEEPEAPKPKKSSPKNNEPTNVAEAIVVPCSLSSKELAGKSMGQIYGEGHIDKLKWIASDYKGNDNAMRVAAQIILKENGAA